MKYSNDVCVPAERIMGRKMIRIDKRSVGTHGIMFSKLMIVSVCTKRSDGTIETFNIIELPTICPYGTFEMIHDLLHRIVAAQECDARDDE